MLAVQRVGIKRRSIHSSLTAAARAVVAAPHPNAAVWPGYKRLAHEQVLAELARASGAAPADFRSKNLSGLDLSGLDFKGANRSAAVLIDTKFPRAKSGGANSTAVTLRKVKGLAGASTQGACGLPAPRQ
jgi:hypothetical protein